MTESAYLDRDGVINVDSDMSVTGILVFLPGVIDAMRAFCEAGYALVIVTNQSGIGRGFYTEADFKDLTERMLEELSREGVVALGYFVPIFRRPHCLNIEKRAIAESRNQG